MGKARRPHYTNEFKRQALSLADKMGLNRAARELGVSRGSIQSWKDKQKTAEPLVAKEINLEEENRRLQKENEELKKVNYILRRAAAVFSQDQLK
jgi:transposase